MDAAWRGGVGCAPVCLDLCVGRSPVREPSPATARHELLDRLSSCGGGDSTMMTNEAKILEAKVTQMSEENRRLTEMITRLYGTQIARNGIDSTNSPSPPPRPVSPSLTTGKKRGRESMDTANSCDANNNNNNQKITGADAESFGVDDGTACRRIKVSRVCRRIDPSDTTLVVKDGYQWRKYGQKVTRDNPSPRAYFRCAFAPSCPVKKKVQRSADDSSVLVATYEGEHNHPHPSPRAGDLPSPAAAASLPCSISINSSGPTITLDLTKNGGGVQAATAAADMKEVCREVASPEFRSALVEQMASALTSDPKFTGALAAAIMQKLPEF
uniref:WRKY domain-containing protein n=1 Tax=Leersia perrieri TaxID=77586 RepID=A0A0D9XDS1_9ORYZ